MNYTILIPIIHNLFPIPHLCLVYVGLATIFGYAWTYLYYSDGPQITWYQLVKLLCVIYFLVSES
jgi:hypothetical protein